MGHPLQRARENVTEIVSVLVTGIWLAALFTGQNWWLAFLLFGYVVIVPLTALLFGDRTAIEEWWGEEEITIPEGSSDEDALQTVRERYARGKLTLEEFEQKLDRLLETESIEEIEGQRTHARDSLDRELEHD